MSHKSYRPLTVLSFRLQHRISRALLGGGWAPRGPSGEDWLGWGLVHGR